MGTAAPDMDGGALGLGLLQVQRAPPPPTSKRMATSLSFPPVNAKSSASLSFPPVLKPSLGHVSSGYQLITPPKLYSYSKKPKMGVA